MNEEISVKIGDSSEPTQKEKNSKPSNPKLSMILRKTLAGEYAIFDHFDMDILVSPEKKQVLAFPKNEMSDDVYAAQDRMFSFLSKKGVVVRESVQSGSIYGSMQATFPDSAIGADTVQSVIYTIGRFLEEDKPYYAHEDALEDEITHSLTEPDKDNSTELGEVPHEKNKGTVEKFPAVKSYYRVY